MAASAITGGLLIIFGYFITLFVSIMYLLGRSEFLDKEDQKLYPLVNYLSLVNSWIFVISFIILILFIIYKTYKKNDFFEECWIIMALTYTILLAEYLIDIIIRYSKLFWDTFLNLVHILHSLF